MRDRYASLRQAFFIVVWFSSQLVFAQDAPTDGESSRNVNVRNSSKTNYPPNIQGAEVHVYKQIGDVSLNAYVFRPKDIAQPAPAIVFFFGGGWRSGSPTQFEEHCRYFAARGMVAMTVDYRVASRHDVKAVACVADAKSAIRWVRAQSQMLGVDTDRIVAGGGSAGGHLAAATGLIADFDEREEDQSVSSCPNALALFNPAVLLAPVPGKTDEYNKKFAEIEPRLGVASQDLSPYHQIANGAPPTIIFHGKADTTVPYWTVQLFENAMLEKGNNCRLIGFDGATHGFFNVGRDEGAHFRKTVNELDQFLVALGYLEKDVSDHAKDVLR